MTLYDATTRMLKANTTDAYPVVLDNGDNKTYSFFFPYALPNVAVGDAVAVRRPCMLHSSGKPCVDSLQSHSIRCCLCDTHGCPEGLTPSATGRACVSACLRGLHGASPHAGQRGAGAGRVPGGRVPVAVPGHVRVRGRAVRRGAPRPPGVAWRQQHLCARPRLQLGLRMAWAVWWPELLALPSTCCPGAGPQQSSSGSRCT